MIPVRTELWDDLNAAASRHALLYELEPSWRRAVEVLTNGDLEDWTGSTPDGWTKIETAGAVTEETVDRYDLERSLSAAKLDVTLASGEMLIQQASLNLEPGAWYRIQTNIKGTLARTKAQAQARWRLRNGTQGQSVDDTAGTLGFSEAWQATDVRINMAIPDSWGTERLWIKTLPTFGVDDTYSLRIEVLNSYNGNHVLLDNISLLGPFDDRGRYFSSQVQTWAGQLYNRLALKHRPPTEELDEIVPVMRVLFSNVGKELMDLVEPVDTLTGGRARVRMVFLDSSDNPKPQQLTLFEGNIERPKKAKDRDLELPVVGLLDGFGIPVPGRSMSSWCPAEFADGVDCNYTQTTTTTNANAGPASTGPITLADGTNVNNGEKIRVGKDGVEVTVASGGGTSSITVDTAITWANGDPVIYTECSREFQAPHGCTARERQDDFLGLLGVMNTSRQGWISLNFKQRVPTDPEIV